MAKEKKIVFIKRGRGSFFMDGTIIKENQTFTAYPSQIPDAFIDLLEQVGEEVGEEEVPVKKKVAEVPVKKKVAEVPVKKKVAEDELPEEVPSNKEIGYYKDLDSPGWYNVYDLEGNQINESRLRNKKADKFMEDLLSK